MVYRQYAPWYVDIRSDTLRHECQMMGHPMDEIRVMVKGHNGPSNVIDLRGIEELLERIGTSVQVCMAKSDKREG